MMKNLTRWFFLAALLFVFVPSVMAAEQTLDTGDTAWILAATALVLFMTIPGLSFFYGGLVAGRNVLSVLMHCFVLTCVMTVLWLVCGYSLSFSTIGMEEGSKNLAAFIGGFDKAFLSGVTSGSPWGTIPELLFFMFQMTFFHHHACIDRGGVCGTGEIFRDAGVYDPLGSAGLRADLPHGVGWCRWFFCRHGRV